MGNDETVLFSENGQRGQPVELSFLLDELLKDGYIDKKAVENCKRSALIKQRTPMHPMTLIGSLKIKNRKVPGSVISVEDIASWMAAKVDLPYQHIDPLKLEVRAITSLNLPLAYIERFNIMPVKVTADKVVIATAEPFVDE